MESNNQNNTESPVTEEQVVQELMNDFLIQTAKFKRFAESASKKDLARAVLSAMHSDLTDLFKDKVAIHRSESQLTDILKRMTNSRLILLNSAYEMQQKQLQTSSQGEETNEETK